MKTRPDFPPEVLSPGLVMDLASMDHAIAAIGDSLKAEYCGEAGIREDSYRAVQFEEAARAGAARALQGVELVLLEEPGTTLNWPQVARIAARQDASTEVSK